MKFKDKDGYITEYKIKREEFLEVGDFILTGGEVAGCDDLFMVIDDFKEEEIYHLINLSTGQLVESFDYLEEILEVIERSYNSYQIVKNNNIEIVEK